MQCISANSQTPNKANNVKICAEYEFVLAYFAVDSIVAVVAAAAVVAVVILYFAYFLSNKISHDNNIKRVHMDGTFETPKTNRSRNKENTFQQCHSYILRGICVLERAMNVCTQLVFWRAPCVCVCVCVASSSNCLGEKWQRSGTERMGKVVGI